MSSAILPHGLERASAALHHNHEGTFLHYKAACQLLASFHLVGVFPPSSPSMFVSSNMSNNSPMGRVRTSPFAANLTPNCGTVVLATDCKSLAFSVPFFGSSYSPELEEPTKTITIIEETN